MIAFRAHDQPQGSSSLVRLKADKIIALGTSRMTSIDRSREEAREKLIQDELDRCNNGFLARLFRREPLTREAAIQYLSVPPEGIEGLFDEWQYTKCLYGKQYDVCSRLLAAAKAANADGDGTVWCSTEDYSRLGAG